MNFIIRDAVPEDSDRLLKLTSLTAMKGVIGLRIDRQPDFFSLLQMSESFIALVAENKLKDIIGCFAATKSYVYIEDKKSTIYYLRDLKVHPKHNGSMLAYSLVKKMYERLLMEGADILCCTMAAGNKAVVPFFQGRAGIPPFTEIAKYSIYQLLPSYNSKYREVELSADKKVLAAFFNNRFKQFSFKPFGIAPHELDDCVNFSVTRNNTVEAAIAAFDPSPYRQNIVTSYTILIAATLMAIRFIKLFLKLPPLPKKNIPLRIIYGKYYACAKNKEQDLISLIGQLRNYAFGKNYHFVAIPSDEKDTAMNKLLKPLSRFVFKSTLLVTSLQKNEGMINSIKQGICFEDYSLL